MAAIFWSQLETGKLSIVQQVKLLFSNVDLSHG